MVKIQNTKNLKGIPYTDCLIYGNAKVGKTRLAATFPSPFYITFIEEEGTESLRGMDIPYVEISSLNDFNEVIKYLKAQLRTKPKDRVNKIETIVIDTSTSLWELIADTKRTAKGTKSDEVSKAKIDWDLRTEINDIFQFYFSNLNAWKREFNINIVWVAHAKEQQDNDQILRRIGVGGTAVSKIMAKNLNYIFYMDVEDGVNLIRLRADKQYQTGVRSHPEVEVPAILTGDDVSYDGIMKALGFTKEEETKPIKVKKTSKKKNTGKTKKN